MVNILNVGESGSIHCLEVVPVYSCLSVGEGGSTHCLDVVPVCSCLSVGEVYSTHCLEVIPVCSCLSVARKKMFSHSQPQGAQLATWATDRKYFWACFLLSNITSGACALERMNSPTKQKESLLF